MKRKLNNLKIPVEGFSEETLSEIDSRIIAIHDFEKEIREVEIKIEQWDPSIAEFHFGEPTVDYDTNSEIYLYKTGYDLGLYWKTESSSSDGNENILPVILFGAIICSIGMIYLKRDKFIKILKK